jgi:hypothetical protein
MRTPDENKKLGLAEPPRPWSTPEGCSKVMHRRGFRCVECGVTVPWTALNSTEEHRRYFGLPDAPPSRDESLRATPPEQRRAIEEATDRYNAACTRTQEVQERLARAKLEHERLIYAPTPDPSQIAKKSREVAALEDELEAAEAEVVSTQRQLNAVSSRDDEPWRSYATRARGVLRGLIIRKGA